LGVTVGAPSTPDRYHVLYTTLLLRMRVKSLVLSGLLVR
jgi:hypothetical protein